MEKQTVAAPVPQLTGTAPIPNIGIPVSGGNPSSYVRAAGNGSIPSADPNWQPSLVSLIIGTEVFHNLGIPASVDNPVESVQAVGRNTHHLPCLTNCPILALVLMTSAPSLISLRNRSLLLLSRIGRRWIFLPLSTNTHILDASHIIHSSLSA